MNFALNRFLMKKYHDISSLLSNLKYLKKKPKITLKLSFLSISLFLPQEHDILRQEHISEK